MHRAESLDDALDELAILDGARVRRAALAGDGGATVPPELEVHIEPTRQTRGSAQRAFVAGLRSRERGADPSTDRLRRGVAARVRRAAQGRRALAQARARVDVQGGGLGGQSEVDADGGVDAAHGTPGRCSGGLAYRTILVARCQKRERRCEPEGHGATTSALHGKFRRFLELLPLHASLPGLSGFLQRLQGFDATGWRRSTTLHPFVVIWFCIAFSGMTLVLVMALRSAGQTLDLLPHVRARPVRAVADAPDGKGVFHGTLRGTTRKSPLGMPVIAYHAWVERVVRTSKNTRRDFVCRVDSLSGLALQDGGSALMLELDATSLSAQSFALERGKVAMLADTVDAPVPSVLGEKGPCAGQLTGELEYHEISWKLNQEVVVSGCKSGQSLQPCGDGADFLVSSCSDGACSDARRAVRVVERREGSGVSTFAGFSFGVFGLFVGVLGVLVLKQHRELEGRRRAVARPA